jgi:hypothetical protein
VVPIYEAGDLSLVSNYGLTLVVSKEMEHVIASYLREIWDKKDGYLRVSTDSCHHFHAKVK